MSTVSNTTAAPFSARPAFTVPAGASALSFGGVIRSEWIKLRSLRSTVWSYLITFGISLGMALLMSWSVVSGGFGTEISAMPAEQQREYILMASTFGVVFGQLVVAVLGVLVISGEYTTGMIRSTLTAVPRRIPALAAKSIVLFVTTFAIGLLSTLGAYVVASIVFGMHDVSTSLGDPDILLPLLGAALYLALIALFALGVGTMLRSSAGGISAALGVILLLPMILGMIPAEWPQEITPYLLSNAGMNIFSQSSITADLGEAGKNLLIVLAWVAASLAGAAVLLKRRDA